MPSDDLKLAMASIIARGEHAHSDRPIIREAADLLRKLAKRWERENMGECNVASLRERIKTGQEPVKLSK